MEDRTNSTITVAAPAKINLTLDVTGRRPNGYHDLVMIMQTIDLCDHITITRTPAPGITLTMNRELPDNCPMEKNLVWKAAALLQETYHITGGFRIYLEKNIPAAAGLAGGSSDCAATLLGINTWCGLDLSVDTLCELGVTLGADVPFCIRKGTMLSEGIGEILTELAPHHSGVCSSNRTSRSEQDTSIPIWIWNISQSILIPGQFWTAWHGPTILIWPASCPMSLRPSRSRCIRSCRNSKNSS